MDAKLRQEADRLRLMGSQQAAGYLMQHPAGDGWQIYRTLILMQHVSWKPADQLRLARHFLANHPQASSLPLKTFASFMSLKNFAKVVNEVWPSDPGHADLFRYHLSGVLKKYEIDTENKAAIDAILAR